MEAADILKPPPFGIKPEDSGICSADPALFHSSGIWGTNAAQGFLSYPLPRLLVQLVVIFTLTQSIHVFLRRFHMPRMVSALMVGFVLGPSGLGRIPKFEKTLFPASGDIFLNTLAKIGYIYYMFLAGVKMDPGMVRKSGKKAWIIGIVSAGLPVAVATVCSSPLSDQVGWYRGPGIKFLVGTLTLTPFPVVANLLNDFQIMNTEIGHLALATSLIRELARFSLNSITTFTRILFTQSPQIAIKATAIFLLLGFVMIFVSRPVCLWIIRQTPEGKHVKRTYISFIIVSAFVAAIIAENIGTVYHYGPFLLGLCVPDGPPLGSTLDKKLDTLISGLFVPLLMTYCGLRSDLSHVVHLHYQMVLWFVCFACGLARFLGSFLPALFCKIPVKDAIALTFILCPQGIVELASFLYALENSTMDKQGFATATETVFITAIVVPLLVLLVYDFSRKYGGYQKRSVVHAANDSELRIFACAHRPDDALAVIKLVENSNPTKEKPITMFALHLVDLIGRATPLIINHQLGQKGSSSGVASRSLQIIELFDYFEQQNLGSVVTTQKYTAVSLPKFMHDDICLMAFDKLASLIILPFHKKWNTHGKIVQDNKVWRTINRNVLQMAPCSVGILIDRRRVNRPTAVSPKSPSSSKYRVSVIFVGGDDDREALAFAKRVVNAPGIQLTVVRLYCDYDDEFSEQQWDTMLDDEVFRELRIVASSSSSPDGDGSNVRFREEKVTNGAELAGKVHAVEEFSDLIMVGRRHNEELPLLAGLTDWMEVPELGPIGDILAAGDTSNSLSVLVVQQQMHLKIK